MIIMVWLYQCFTHFSIKMINKIKYETNKPKNRTYTISKLKFLL